MEGCLDWCLFHRRPLFHAAAIWCESLCYCNHTDGNGGMGDQIHPSLDRFVLGCSMDKAIRIQVKKAPGVMPALFLVMGVYDFFRYVC